MKQHKMKKVCSNKLRDALTLKKSSRIGLKWREGGGGGTGETKQKEM